MATVLSTISGTPTSCATPATPSMSRTSLLGVGDRLAEERLGVGPDRGPPRVEVVRVLDERHLDAELGQRVVEQVVRAAVQARAGDDVVAGLGDVEDRERLRRLAAGDEQRADAALEARDALLHRVLGRVHDPRVDVAELLQREQVRGVLGVAEDERRGLVDRQGAGAGGAVRGLAGVDLAGLEGPAVVHEGSWFWRASSDAGRNALAGVCRGVAPDRGFRSRRSGTRGPGRGAAGNGGDGERVWRTDVEPCPEPEPRAGAVRSTGAATTQRCAPRTGGPPGPALASATSAVSRVITRGTPPRLEGCRPASRGLMLALLT